MLKKTLASEKTKLDLIDWVLLGKNDTIQNHQTNRDTTLTTVMASY